MEEKIITRQVNNLKTTKPMDRNAFYEKCIKDSKLKKEPKISVDIINVFLFNEHGEIFIQKRSKDKFHNPNLLDKSLGGHVQYGDSPEYTVMIETVQELLVPSITIYNEGEFKKALKTLKKYLSTVAVIKPVDKKLMILNRVINDKEVRVANYVHLYFGVYGGRVKTVDREAKGVLQYSLNDLQDEIESLPQIFTNDLSVLIKNYKTQLQTFTTLI